MVSVVGRWWSVKDLPSDCAKTEARSARGRNDDGRRLVDQAAISYDQHSDSMHVLGDIRIILDPYPILWFTRSSGSNGMVK